MKIAFKILVLAVSINLLNSCCPTKATSTSPGFPCNLLYSPVAGIDYSKLSEDGAYGSLNAESLLSYRLGLDAMMPLNEQVSLESGLHLAGKGGKSSFESDGDGEGAYSFEDKTRLNYLDVPLLARYRLGESGFSIYGGVQPSLLLSAKQKSDGTGSESQSTNIRDRYKSLDMAGSLGVGYGFGNGLRINFGYDHGFSNIVKSDAFGSGKISNRTFKLTLGYNLGKRK